MTVRTNPLVRVKAKIAVKTPYVRSLPRQHTAFLTVNLALTRTSGAAREAGGRRTGHPVRRGAGRAACETGGRGHGQENGFGVGETASGGAGTGTASGQEVTSVAQGNASDDEGVTVCAGGPGTGSETYKTTNADV